MTSIYTRRIFGPVVATMLLSCGWLLTVAHSPAAAAKPATAAQKRAMAKAVPAAVAFAGVPKAMRRCYSLDRPSAKRSTTSRSYRFAFVRYNERSSGRCSVPDASHSFHVYWRATTSGLKPRGYTNQFACFRRMKVPMSVQREAFPGCPVF